VSEADLLPALGARLAAGTSEARYVSQRALNAPRHPVEGTGAYIRRRPGLGPGIPRWCAVWYVRCFDGPPRRPGAFPLRSGPRSIGFLRPQRNLPQPGAIHDRRLRSPPSRQGRLVSGAPGTADAERRRRPLSGVIVEAPLERVRRAPQHGLVIAHGVQGHELADRMVTHHDLVGHRGDQRAAGGRVDVGHEIQLRGRTSADCASGTGTTATRRSIVTYRSTLAPRCRIPGPRPPAASAPRRGSVRRRRRRWAGCGC
jgi:hypothetical protein